MLIGISYKVLSAIVYTCKREDKVSDLTLTVHFHNRINALDLRPTMLFLAENGYIEIIENNEAYLMVKPTYKGNHFKAFIRAEIISFIAKSILTPIVVSIVTTLITLRLQLM